MLFVKNVALGRQHSNVGSVGKNKQRRSEHSEAVRRGFQKNVRQQGKVTKTRTVQIQQDSGCDCEQQPTGDGAKTQGE